MVKMAGFRPEVTVVVELQGMKPSGEGGDDGGGWLGAISLAPPCGPWVGPCPWLRRGFSDRDGR